MADKFYGNVVADSTSVSVDVILRSSTDSSALTGITFSGITAYYYRQGASAAVAITPVTLAANNTAYTSGGFRQIDATNLPGRYRFDIPDAAFASGADWVGVQIKITAGTGFNFDAHYDIASSAQVVGQLMKFDLS